MTTMAATGMVLKPAFAQPSDLVSLSLKEVSELLRAKAVSPVELTEACLKRISTYNPSLNAFITVTVDQAMESARAMEVEQRRGKWRGPLHGIPLAVKDNIDTAGIRTTAASELFKDRVPSADAEVVRRLKNAGAILLGKTNLHEFAYGGSSSVSYFGPVHNPWALDRVSGGSSGGSAVATASELCFGSLGTDTAGSIRIPASYCGIVGFKPSYGRVSNHGVVPLSWTLDHVGPLCRSVEDTGIMLGVIAGYDALDPSTAEMPFPDYNNALRANVSKLRLGVPRKPFFDGVDVGIAKAVEAAIEVLRKLVPEVADITLPAVDISMDEIYARVRSVEAYTYHSRWIAESAEKYQPSTRERIQNGAKVKAEDYVQARHFTPAELAEIDYTLKDVRCAEDPLFWAQTFTATENPKWKDEGLEFVAPFPHKSYFNVLFDAFAKSKRLFIPKAREMLTSWCVMVWAAAQAQWHKAEVIVQTDSEDKAKGLVGYAVCLYRHQQAWLKARHPLNRPPSLLEIEWASGGRIFGIAHGENKIRLYHPTIYIMDEAAFLPEAEGCYNVAHPVAGQIIAVSSAGPGWFADQCSR